MRPAPASSGWKAILAGAVNALTAVAACFNGFSGPFVFDYGTELVRKPADVAPYALILAVPGTGPVIALWRRPVLGFLAAGVFLLLAPNSSTLPVATQTRAEHRRYLSLAAALMLIVWGAHAAIGRRAATSGSRCSRKAGCLRRLPSMKRP